MFVRSSSSKVPVIIVIFG